MEHIKIEGYNIIDTFRKNEKQDIFIGNSTGSEDDTVIINIIKEKSILQLFKSMDILELHNTLENLRLANLDIVDEMETLILVTKLQRATPMENYLEEYEVELKERMNIALDYMKEIIRYKELNPVIQSILVDEAQLVLDDGRLAMDELLIIEEEGVENIDFNKVCRKVGNVLYKLILMDGIEASSKLLTSDLIEFIANIRNDNHCYSNLEELMTEYRKHYIYFICMKGMMDEEEETFPAKPSLKEQTLIQYGGKSKTDNKIKYLAISVAVVVLIVAGVFYKLYNPLKEKTPGDDPALPSISTNEDVRPVAAFELVKSDGFWRFINKSYAQGDAIIEEYLWEISKDGKILQELKIENLKLNFKDPGTYIVDLMVRDNTNQWSHRYSMEVYVDDSLAASTTENNDFVLAYDSNKVQHDLENVRKEGISYKISERGPTVLSLKDIGFSSNGILSFWLMADATDRMTITMEGYQQDRLVLKEDINHRQQSSYTWEMIKFQMADKVDAIDITFNDYIYTLWVGDIQLELFK